MAECIRELLDLPTPADKGGFVLDLAADVAESRAAGLHGARRLTEGIMGSIDGWRDQRFAHAARGEAEAEEQ